MENIVIQGLGPLNEYLDRICSMEANYSCSNKINPPHIILNLDPGYGQTHITKGIAERYRKRNLRPFHARRNYLELNVDGDINQIEKAFSQINEQLIEFSNEPSGIVAVDVSKLAEHVNEKPMEVFLEKIRSYAEDVMFVFFISSTESRNQSKMIQKIKGELLGDVDQIILTGYEPVELIVIALNQFDAGRIGFKGDLDVFFEAWEKKMIDDGIKSPKQAIKQSHQFLQFYDKDSKVIDYDAATDYIRKQDVEKCK